MRALFPLMIQASAWVYGREDAEQERRRPGPAIACAQSYTLALFCRLDALLLPPLLLAFAGLDAAEAGESRPRQDDGSTSAWPQEVAGPLLRLEEAAAEFCKATLPRCYL